MTGQSNQGQDLVQQYYKESNPAKRGRILDELCAQEESKENLLRKEIYRLRYSGTADNKEKTQADGYVRMWMEMKFTAQNNAGWFGTKREEKTLRNMLAEFGIEKILSEGELGKQLLYEEFYHLTALYMQLGLTDKNYSSAFMGMMQIKEDQIYSKLAMDIYRVAYVIPKRVKMVEEFQLLTQAATDAYYQIAPDYRGFLEELCK